MRFTIKDFTAPLTADVLAQKDFSFGSGGGGGGGGFAIKPEGDILANGLTVEGPAVAAEETAVIAGFDINLLGGRKLFAIATVGALNFASTGGECTLQIYVGADKVAEAVVPVGSTSSIVTFQGLLAATTAGVKTVWVRVVNGPVALTPINATISVMEFQQAE